MLLGTPYNQTTSLKNRSVVFIALLVLWQDMKCSILENLYAITNMKSLSFLDLGEPKIKFIEIWIQGSLGTCKSVYNS